MTAHDTRTWITSAEAVFGSNARGTDDAISDRDILIVDDSVETLKRRGEQLEKKGWSVASYTFSKLEYLAKHGYLFIQHLKLESRILRDRGRRLESILQGFRPKLFYGADLIECSRLSSLSANVPNTDKGVLFSADVLYVSVRNFGILSLAERGHHVYSFSEILHLLERLDLVKNGGASKLHELRTLKSCYRDFRAPPERVLEHINEALSFLPPKQFPRAVSTDNPSAILVSAPPSKRAPAYHVLRDLEKRYLALAALIGDTAISSDLDELKSWVANPRVYAGISQRLAPQLRCSMANVLRRKELRLYSGTAKKHRAKSFLDRPIIEHPLETAT